MQGNDRGTNWGYTMTYQLITQHDSRNFTPAAQVPAVYGRRRSIDSITIHWWGLPEWNATFEGTTDFLCKNTKPTSAHEVIEAGRVAVIVNHGDAAWAAGNAVGNATSIHLELNPRASDGDYVTAAERIRDIREMHGKDLPLIPHRDWQATMCPGHYDLARLDRMARDTNYQSATTEDDMPSAQEIAAAVWGFTNPEHDHRDMRQVVADLPVAVWSYSNPGIGGGDAYQILRDAVANTDRIASSVASVAALKASEGATVEQITEAVKQAISESVVKVDVTVEDGK